MSRIVTLTQDPFRVKFGLLVKGSHFEFTLGHFEPEFGVFKYISRVKLEYKGINVESMLTPQGQLSLQGTFGV